MSRNNDVETVRNVSWLDKQAEEDFYHSCYSYYNQNLSVLRNVDSNIKEDIFHDSFLIIWTEIQNRKIFVRNNRVWRIRKNGQAAEMSCSLNTFLLSIAKKRYFNIIRHEGPGMFVDIDSPMFYYLKDEREGVNYADEERKIQIVDDMLQELPQRCREILSFFYIKGYTLDKIMELRREKNISKDGLKTGKSKCLSQLRNNVKRMLSYAGV